MKTLAIDGNNILVRGIKAAEGRLHLSAEVEGEEVNTAPLLIFVNAISRYIRDERPDRVVVCWDGGRSSHRLAIYEDYKGARPEPTDPAEHRDHTPFVLAKEFLTLAGIHHIEVSNVEADDLVAAYWHRHQLMSDLSTFVIVSGDKDFLQLLDPGTVQIRPGTGDNETWDAERTAEKMGCRPEHIPAVMALTGDSGDGVPGIPGFGVKTACKFLAKYDWDLDALLAAGEAKLDSREDEVRRNLALVDLRTPIPGIEVPEAPVFDPTNTSSILYQELLDWLSRYRMDSIQDRLADNSLWR